MNCSAALSISWGHLTAICPDSTAKPGGVGARLIELLPLNLNDKQHLLEIDDVHARLARLRELMGKARISWRIKEITQSLSHAAMRLACAVAGDSL